MNMGKEKPTRATIVDDDNTFSYASHLNFEMINVSCSLEQHDPSPAHFSWQQLVTKFYYGQCWEVSSQAAFG